MSEIFVVKRDGSKELLDLDKLHRVVEFACDGLAGVSASEVEINSRIHLQNNIKTSDIQETLIKSAANLISEENPNYQYVAARLVSYHLRKMVYGSYTPPALSDHYYWGVDNGAYSSEIGEAYSADDWEALNAYINHERDDLLAYAGIEQFRTKYLVRNRVTGQIFETPQMAYMLIAMTLFQNEKEDRLKWVKDFYDAISTFDISLPTPIMGGCRTPDKQFSSCVLIAAGDSIDSMSAASHAIRKYAAHRAGIGIDAQRIRAVGSAIRNGQVTHTGVIPFLKCFEADINSTSQGGLRKGSATCTIWGLHYEIEDLVVLKNNKGTEESRVRHMDYNVTVHRLMYERLLQGGNITLFSPSDVPEVFEAFFGTDIEKFRELYEKAEKSRVRKKTIKAVDYFTNLLTERKDTGRVYIMNVDNVNCQGMFKSAITQSNLCQEIVEPTTPLEFDDPNNESEIALCTLAALNWGKANSPEWFEKPARLAVRALDNLLDYQNYPHKNALKALKRRNLGIGIINLAYWLAKHDITYTDPDLAHIDQMMEGMAFWITKASVDLAKERGACEYLDDTYWSEGVFPMDIRKSAVDDLTPHNPMFDWDGLREEMKVYGIRNSTLMAAMPAETSAIVSNATNGVEPVLSLITTKGNKDFSVSQVAPEIRKLKNKYEPRWQQRSPEGYLQIMCVLQKWMDQAISVNTWYRPDNYENNEIPMSVLVKDILNFYKWGGKNLYYHLTADAAGEVEFEDESDCESCKI